MKINRESYSSYLTDSQYAGVDNDFDTLYAENYEVPKTVYFERDIFEVMETLQ